MKLGYAPTTKPKDWAPTNEPGAKVLQIHHKEELQYGGAMYDLGNLLIVTPKQHKIIHKDGKYDD
jgi:hypothetical protein